MHFLSNGIILYEWDVTFPPRGTGCHNGFAPSAPLRPCGLGQVLAASRLPSPRVPTAATVRMPQAGSAPTAPMLSLYPVFSMEGSVKRMPVRPKIVCSRTENRLAQIVPSFCFCFFTKRMAWFTNNTF